jgi:hypothetical protein
MQDDSLESIRRVWREATEAYDVFTSLRAKLYSDNRSQLVEMVNEALIHPQNRSDQYLAFEIAETLTECERLKLLTALLSYCSCGRLAGQAKSLILALPRHPVLEVIEGAAEPVLAENDFLDWCNILDVFNSLDKELARRFATRMAAHDDPNIREWGSDFLKED